MEGIYGCIPVDSRDLGRRINFFVKKINIAFNLFYQVLIEVPTTPPPPPPMIETPVRVHVHVHVHVRVHVCVLMNHSLYRIGILIITL